MAAISNTWTTTKLLLIVANHAACVLLKAISPPDNPFASPAPGNAAGLHLAGAAHLGRPKAHVYKR